MTRRLIVNADDYGITRGVSEGILAAHRHGIVTSTTVLVTGDIAPDLVARARECGLGLGVHVNLTLGSPLTRGRSLVDAGGRFVRDPRRAAAAADATEVRAEVEAQLDRFGKLFKRAPTHLDSHHHVGLYAPVRDVVLDVARARGLAVRSQDATARARAQRRPQDARPLLRRVGPRRVLVRGAHVRASARAAGRRVGVHDAPRLV